MIWRRRLCARSLDSTRARCRVALSMGTFPSSPPTIEASWTLNAPVCLIYFPKWKRDSARVGWCLGSARGLGGDTSSLSRSACCSPPRARYRPFTARVDVIAVRRPELFEARALAKISMHSGVSVSAARAPNHAPSPIRAGVCVCMRVLCEHNMICASPCPSPCRNPESDSHVCPHRRHGGYAGTV